MTEEEKEYFLVESIARIAAALESINRQLFLIREMKEKQQAAELEPQTPGTI